MFWCVFVLFFVCFVVVVVVVAAALVLFCFVFFGGGVIRISDKIYRNFRFPFITVSYPMQQSVKYQYYRQESTPGFETAILTT